jgi:starvation-inducible DNA-binding protein
MTSETTKSRHFEITLRGDLGEAACAVITRALNAWLADVFVIYLVTENLHGHISGPSFRDHRRPLDEQADQISDFRWASFSTPR